MLAVTGRCNLRCAHCWVRGGPAAEGPVPTRAALRLVGEFLELGGREVCLTGGELLTHPEWRAVVAGCATLAGASRLKLQTNATLIGPEEARFLSCLGPGGPTVQVSLDGAHAHTHDRIRGGGTFARAIRGLSHLAAAGLGPCIELLFTETRQNLGESPEVFRLAERFGVARIRWGSLVPAGRASASRGADVPTASQYEALCERFRRDGVFRRGCARYGSPVAVAWLGAGPRPPHACSFVENPYVTARGLVFPCPLFRSPDHAASGAFGRPWADVLTHGAPLWGTLRAASRRRSEATPACRACEARPVCRAGCMGRAYAVRGKALAPEDRCVLRRAVARLQREGRTL
ncbi:radical SAM protein [Deferrisoma sp.]